VEEKLVEKARFLQLLPRVHRESAPGSGTLTTPREGKSFPPASKNRKQRHLLREHIHTASFLGKTPEGFIKAKISIKTPKFPVDFFW